MKITRWLSALTAPLLFLAGCQTHDQRWQTSADEPSDGAAIARTTERAAAPGDDAGPMNPIDNYKHERMRNAMRGLRYESGRAEIDAAEAAKVVTGRDAAAAAESNALGTELFETSMYVEAIEAQTRAVLQDPDVASYYSDLGLALTRKGKMDEAIAAYQSALDRDPESEATLARLAMGYELANRSAAAVEAWEQVVARVPTDTYAHMRLAVLNYYAGDYALAWEHVHAAEAAGGSVPPQFRPLLAQQMAEPN